MQAHTIEIHVQSPTIYVVRLYGEHDVSSGGALSAALVGARGYDHVVVDLGRCAFVDSTVITHLLGAAKRAHQRGGSVELVVPVEANVVRRTLELANVQMALPFHASLTAAVESIAAAERSDGACHGGRLGA
jgi:anti-anti-sigma factor